MIRSLLLVFALSFSAVGFAREKIFYYPSTITQALGEKTVKLDLSKEYEKELEAAKLEFASISEENKQKAAITEKFKKENEKVFDEVRKIKPASDSKNLSSATMAQAQLILDKIPKHPIVSDKGSLKYDTPMRQIGYCFGKAAYVHMELLRHGIEASSIAKMFALGPLIHTGRGWEFHVATMVLAREGGWWVIDALEKKVMTLEEWKASVLKLSQSLEYPRVRFYFSDATKLNPTPGGYSSETLDLQYYKGYFRDLGRWFMRHPLKPKEVFTR